MDAKCCDICGAFFKPWERYDYGVRIPAPDRSQTVHVPSNYITVSRNHPIPQELSDFKFDACPDCMNAIGKVMLYRRKMAAKGI